MYCKRCGKWAGAYARAAGQSMDDICACQFEPTPIEGLPDPAEIDRLRAENEALTNRIAELEAEDFFHAELVIAQERIAVLEAALNSIANNTCCDTTCREAALVARCALAGEAQDPRRVGTLGPPDTRGLPAQRGKEW